MLREKFLAISSDEWPVSDFAISASFNAFTGKPQE
jgi:hypothetical protein